MARPVGVCLPCLWVFAWAVCMLSLYLYSLHISPQISTRRPRIGEPMSLKCPCCASLCIQVYVMTFDLCWLVCPLHPNPWPQEWILDKVWFLHGWGPYQSRTTRPTKHIYNIGKGMFPPSIPKFIPLIQESLDPCLNGEKWPLSVNCTMTWRKTSPLQKCSRVSVAA